MNSEKIFIFMGKSAVFVLSLPNKIARLSAVCIITKYITLIKIGGMRKQMLFWQPYF